MNNNRKWWVGGVLLAAKRRTTTAAKSSEFRGRHFCSAPEPNSAPNAFSGWRQSVSSSARPDLDFEFLLDDANAAQIEENIRCRKGIGDLQRVRSLWTRLQQHFAPFTPSGDAAATRAGTSDELRKLWDQFYAEAALLPNISDPEAPVGDASAARCVALVGPEMPSGGDSKATAYAAEAMVSGWHSLRYPRAGSGGRSYALFGPLALIEQSLMDHAFDFLYEQLRLEEGKGIARVELVNVDDILPVSTTRACGVQQRADNCSPPIQYRVFRAHQLKFDDDLTADVDAAAAVGGQPGDEHPSDELRANNYNGLCLSGTAEMGIAHKLKGRVFDECELPAYFMAQSRCFRPELASNQMDSGLYRVHEFNKIELFAVCTERQSVAELQRIVRLQQSLIDSLQLRYRVLDMPTEELGAPAARKFDLEAWMPGRNCWGELASASNCTDFQARRLQCKYRCGTKRARRRLQGK
uniref:serine--tRNA ligase n=1 Tax=Globodera rostochiensis TaxID=31243 RepID=A0A914GYB1_GLORO